MREAALSLERIRADIDAIDDRIQDLLVERTALVEGVLRAKAGGPLPAYRPGREAAILRRLAERHSGGFPRLALVRIWREIIAASLGLQGRFVVAAQGDAERGHYRDAARDHFGITATITMHQTMAGVVNAVTEGSATVGVLPFPTEDQPVQWWTTLSRGEDGPTIVARLPFAPATKDVAEAQDALCIAMMAPEPSGDDLSFITVTADAESSRGRIADRLRAAGFQPRRMVPRYDRGEPDETLYLVELEGFVERSDERIDRLLDAADTPVSSAWVLGAYARPFAPGAQRPLARASGAGGP